jgi:hypothetical protein
MTIPPGLAPTANQVDYVLGMQRRLHLTDALLNNHCTERFKAPFNRLDRAQVSALIDEMKGWQAIPAQLRRESGQQDLPGFGG